MLMRNLNASAELAVALSLGDGGSVSGRSRDGLWVSKTYVESPSLDFGVTRGRVE
jgi:hypothetical protein